LGSCQPNVCPLPGEIFCPGVSSCVQVSSTREHCGNCDLTCPGGSCVNGQCSCQTTIDCPAGYVCSHSVISTNPIVPSGAPENPVITQGPGFCTPPACLPGQVFCPNINNCTTTSLDPFNCGQCGTICKSGTCNSGACTCTTQDDCPNGYDCLFGTCSLH
jgi:hypothetical protein